jgi:hypothetical protein
MTIRDLETASIGAFLSFAITLGTVENAPAFVRYGLFSSLALIAITAIADFVRRPWLSVVAIPILSTTEGTVIQVGFKNHGREPTNPTILDILAPDNLSLVACEPDGTKVASKVILSTPEIVDGVHESTYWQGILSFAPGSSLIYIRIDLPDIGTFLRLNLGEKRKDLFIHADRLHHASTEVTFAPVRARIWASARRLRRLGK